MKPKKDSPDKGSGHSIPSDYLIEMDKVVETLTLKAMAAGNDGDFNTAFSTMEVALWISQSLENKCLEAVLLNNMGLLYTMNGAWDRAMLTFDHSMEIAIAFCPSNDNFLTTLKRNIFCLFNPRIVTPSEPKDDWKNQIR